MLDCLAKNSSTLSDLANLGNVLTAIVALFALFFAGWQILANKRNQKEATAKSIYKDYLRLAVENPELSGPDFEKIRQWRKDDKEKYEKYEDYVAYMLFACEEILDLFPSVEGWNNTIKDELSYHEAYLRGSFGNKIELYCKPLQELINQIISTKA